MKKNKIKSSAGSRGPHHGLEELGEQSPALPVAVQPRGKVIHGRRAEVRGRQRVVAPAVPAAAEPCHDKVRNTVRHVPVDAHQRCPALQACSGGVRWHHSRCTTMRLLATMSHTMHPWLGVDLTKAQRTHPPCQMWRGLCPSRGEFRSNR